MMLGPMPTTQTSRFLRRLYSAYLSQQNSQSFRPHQDFESLHMLMELYDEPRQLFDSVERFATSIIFSAAHGARLQTLGHPMLQEFIRVWDVQNKCAYAGARRVDDSDFRCQMLSKGLYLSTTFRYF